MSSKQFWVTATATVLALSAFGPRSSGVWAQSEIAACQAGWEWARYIHSLFASKKRQLMFLFGRSRVDSTPVQNRNSLGQDPCVISSMLDAACRGVGECACK